MSDFVKLCIGVVAALGAISAVLLYDATQVNPGPFSVECQGRQGYVVRVEHGERIAYAVTGQLPECAP
jgi:hypothetical protein